MENSNIPYQVSFPLSIWFDAKHKLVNFEYANAITRRTAKSMGAKVVDGMVQLTQSMINEELVQIEQHLMELN